MSATDNTGLGLFDDTASAVGNFPTALRGYDRAAVDDYVRTLESNVVQSRRHAAQVEQQVSSLQDQLSESTDKQVNPEDVDYSNLGGRANDILRLAQEQARDLVENATVESEKIKEQARRDAEDTRTAAGRESEQIRTNGVGEIEKLRTTLHAQVQSQIDKAKTEAETLLAAARRESDALRRGVEHEAQTTRQNAYLDTEKLRRSVEREAAEARQRIALEREQAVAHLKSVHDEASTKTAALLAEATQHHTRSSTQLESDISEGARLRAEAVAEAERLKLAAVQESEARIGTAKKQATAISERTQQEFAWRKQQLRRETELLHQRKQAVLSQLASLSALAEQTAHSFPDLDSDGDDLDSEPGDRTVLRPGGDPGGEGEASSTPSVTGDTTASTGPADETTPTSETATSETSTAETSTSEPATPPAADADAKTPDEPALDGDATILIPATDAPAGTTPYSAPRA